MQKKSKNMRIFVTYIFKIDLHQYFLPIYWQFFNIFENILKAFENIYFALISIWENTFT